MPHTDRNKRTINDYRIVFKGEMDNISIDSSENKTVDLTAEIEKQVSLVETLDKYDDMQMKINISSYKQIGKYGIAYNEKIHGNRALNLDEDVILADQYDAAEYVIRTLRGFGILADTVGSGKTYEAGVILSELALAGKITNLLIVVPNQELLVKWKRTLELEFGMGEGTIHEVGEIESFSLTDENGRSIPYTVNVTCKRKGKGQVKLSKPIVPMIVTKENFVRWDYQIIEKLLFECIVVDEAHFLNEEDGDGAKAMRRLSKLMENKKLANKDNCILITATPHSGNLEKMFHLWYFKAADGGVPSDFDPSVTEKSETYKKFKARFDDNCRNAKTVAEFIEAAKNELVLAAGNVGQAFTKYLANQDMTTEQYKSLNESRKRSIRNDFLDADGNEEIKKEVLKDTSNLYHLKVLGMIMRRKTHAQKNGIKKDVENVFICPVTPETLRERELELEESRNRGEGVCNSLDRIYEKDAITVKEGKNTITMSFDDYCKKVDSSKHVSLMIDHVLSNAVFEVGDKKPFVQADSAKYYKTLLSGYKRRDGNGKLDNQFRILYDYDSENTEAVFEIKLKELERVLGENPDDRILVFFDYQRKDNSKDGAEWNKIYDRLSEDPRFAKRLILATNGNDAVRVYNEIENAIFLAGSERYTEGIDMQSGHIVVNFSVTHDPVAMSQRVGRVFRLGQEKNVKIISFAMMNELEGYALAYQNCIGLLDTNEGDATIIAGSNSENMKAFTCKVCENVELITDKEYDEEKDENGFLYCKNGKCKKQKGGNEKKGMPLEEISAKEYKCNTCGAKLSKRFSEDGGYYCLSESNHAKGKLYRIKEPGAKNTIVLGCSKLCIIKRCKKIAGFGKSGSTAEPCLIIKNKIDDINEARAICKRCPNLENGECSEYCSALMENSFEKCGSCNNAECTPKPHKLYFKNDVAQCPVCQRGKLKASGTKTFASYMFQSFEYGKKGGINGTFCNKLILDTRNVEDIREILDRKNQQVKD
ncbi:MAG: DEAD/DEAH box helicase family protein [Clostridia bacterium]|nr:DEAD/DEAH box helicase family protein [Clostridia bacterium]